MLPAGKIRRLQSLLRLSLAPPNERILQSFLWINRREAMSLFSPDLREQLTCDTIDSSHCAGLLAAIPEEHDPLNQMLQLETNCFLAAHNLNYLDKIGMAHSVEIRVPYLDTELAKLSASVPPQLKMKGSETKYLLKKVASRYVPEHIIKRPRNRVRRTDTLVVTGRCRIP
ncbi:MAG: asparagine synthase-related protein [Chitinophagaceae bacterium]